MLLAKRSELGEPIFIFFSMKKFITMLAELAQGGVLAGIYCAFGDPKSLSCLFCRQVLYIESVQYFGLTFCEISRFKKIQFTFEIIRDIGVLITSQVGG